MDQTTWDQANVTRDEYNCQYRNLQLASSSNLVLLSHRYQSNGWLKCLFTNGLVKMETRVQILTKFGLRWDSSEGEHFFDLDEKGKTIKIYKNARKASVVAMRARSLQRW